MLGMVKVRKYLAGLFALLSFSVFGFLVLSRGDVRSTYDLAVADRVVISAPVQVLLAAGDRFLAANIETIRVMATASDNPAYAEENALYRVRAHRVVAELNPCHEDSYYVANAMLSWGGAPVEGLDVLRKAMECRFWDEYPPFFYGFNQWFFYRDADEARRAMDLGADRAVDAKQAATMRRIGVMIQAREFIDERSALAFLRIEIERARDPKLKDMLEKRLIRLQGLIALRDAQERYEQLTGKVLVDPQALLDSGVLGAVPQDPLRLGYEFVDGRFRLREMKIPGVERRQ